jgi:hypothetical protein
MPFAFLSSWLRPRSRRHARPPRRRRPPLLLEALEDRLPPGDLSGNLGMAPFGNLLDAASWNPTDRAVREKEAPSEAPAALNQAIGSQAAGSAANVASTPIAVSATPSVSVAFRGDPVGESELWSLWSFTDFSLGDPLSGDHPAAQSTGFRGEELVPPSAGGAVHPFAAATDNNFSAGLQTGSAAVSDTGAVPLGPHQSGESAQLLAAASMFVPAPPPAQTPPAPNGDSTGGGPSPALTVTLQAPGITNQAQPTLTVVVTDPTSGSDGPSSDLFLVGPVDRDHIPTAAIDIDLNHNGRFDAPGETGFTTVQLYGSLTGATPVRLDHGLEEGTYQLRARVTDAGGNEFTSPTVTMRVDLHAGYLGSDALRRLYSDYVLATTGQLDPVWSQPFWGGDGTALADQYARKFRLPAPNPASLTPEQFNARLHAKFMTDQAGRVLVNVRSIEAGQLPALQTGLEQLGMTVVHVSTDQQLISGYLPINQIPNVLTLPGYGSLTPGAKMRTKVGSVTTEGDAVILGPSFRAATGATGQGVSVGVISDSANRVGGGLADSQRTGDLPANVSILQDGMPGDTDEGRAMMEIVHDVAPGANLLFHTASPVPQVFADGIRRLANAGARVIADDVGYADEPMFNDGVVAQAVDQVASRQNVVYMSAAGNDSDIAYDGAWSEMRRTLFGFQFDVQDFGGGDFLQNFTLPVGQTMVLAFQYDDAFLEGGTGQANFQVQTDLDVYITNATGTRLFDAFLDFNDITDEAFEFVVFTNDGSFGTNNFAMFFDHFGGPRPTRVRWVSFGGDDPQAEFQGGPTLYGAPAACNAIAVGAVPAATPGRAESFTSQGGALPYFFDVQGNRLAAPQVRNKPNLAAPDSVSTSFFPAPAPNNIFSGTSAATPHIAAAAALYISQAPFATAPQIFNQLQRTALDVGAPGYDFLTGTGLFQLEPIRFVDTTLLEPNETSDQPIQFGTLTTAQQFDGLSIVTRPTGLPDYDWFRWTAGRPGLFTASIETHRLLSAEGFTCDPATVGMGQGDLELYVYTIRRNTLVLLDASTVPGSRSQTVQASVNAGEVILVEIKGRNFALGQMSQAAYDMTIDLT